MLLTVDIGNTSIDFGIFNEEGNLVMKSKISADKGKCSDEYAVLLMGIISLHGIAQEHIAGAIISSVVPPLTAHISNAIHSLFGIKALEVGPGIKTGLKIKIDSQAELGADIVSNAVAAMALKESPVLIVDIGTATTFTVIDKTETLQGVIIAPGIRLSLDALSSYASELPDVSIAVPRGVVGKNTRSSMNSGVLYGQAFMIDGFAEKIKETLGTDKLNVLVTGGLAETVLPLCKQENEYYSDLTLLGLKILYYKNFSAK